MTSRFLVCKERPIGRAPLDVDLHHKLIAAASARGMACFQDFADYYEDAEVAIDDLPALAEQA